MHINSFPFQRQLDSRDCGPACLRMISRYYGKDISMEALREISFISREGTSFLGLRDAAISLGFESIGVLITSEQLVNDSRLPCIVHWNGNHFVVLYKVVRGQVFYIADPAHGIIKLNRDQFMKFWTDYEEKGHVLLLEPLRHFTSQRAEKSRKGKGLSFVGQYLSRQKLKLLLLVLLIFATGIIQLVFPYLTQMIVDRGIYLNDPSFVQLVLFALFVLLLSRTVFDFLRSRILLLISTRLSISLISGFLGKLMRLPLKFFESRYTGDILQRIWDHNRIQNFLMYTSISMVFGIFSLVVFSFFLAFYSMQILLVFLAGSLVYFIWAALFMKKRLYLEYQRFNFMSDNQNSLYEIITGMQEIRLNNCGQVKRKRWEHIQESLFSIGLKNLRITQYQQIGGLFFSESKNLLITGLSAYAVIDGSITIGMMVAIQYIIGQLNSPVDQMIGLLQSGQDAKISLERFMDVHNRRDEEDEGVYVSPEMMADKSITLKNVDFYYEGPNSPKILDQLSLDIKEGQVTAIVGPSGSGKTTLIKLLLGLYKPWAGEIMAGGTTLENIPRHGWRASCGAVMQDGFIFSDTIAGNIAPATETPDMKRVKMAAEIANLLDFINELPRGFNTKIGQEGSGLSQGQKQKILIARAVYKDPGIIFLDEATNALDAENERLITENLLKFSKNRTVVIVAHRLSTVKNASHIIVIDKGRAIEKGNHNELLAMKGMYYRLVRDQIEFC